MKVSEIMSRKVMMINTDTPLAEAAEKMKSSDIGALPVVEGDKIRGMLTDRDIVLRAVAEKRDLRTTKASEVMTERIKYIFEDDDIAEAAEMMKDKQIRRLVVLNHDKRLVGLVSLGDISCKSHDHEMVSNISRCVSESSMVHASHG